MEVKLFELQMSYFTSDWSDVSRNEITMADLLNNNTSTNMNIKHKTYYYMIFLIQRHLGFTIKTSIQYFVMKSSQRINVWICDIWSRYWLHIFIKLQCLYCIHAKSDVSALPFFLACASLLRQDDAIMYKVWR